MKKQILKSALIAMAGIGLLAGSALAAPFNDRDPQISTPGLIGPGGELTLQQVINNAMAGYSVPGKVDTPINTLTNQSSAAIWQPSEGDTSSYMLALITAGTTGKLGVYSYADNNKTYEFANFDGTHGTIKASFEILADGSFSSGSDIIAGFGDSFGFYWVNNGQYQYTEDTRNTAGAARALAYEVAEGTTLLARGFIRQPGGSLLASSAGSQILAKGSNDWILAFEDGNDMDYQDAVFYIEDMQAVPEPATMLLFGTGILGLAGIARRRNSN